jgi:Tfp pilus assembly protein PilP
MSKRKSISKVQVTSRRKAFSKKDKDNFSLEKRQAIEKARKVYSKADLNYSIENFGTVGITRNVKKGESIVSADAITDVEEDLESIKDYEEILKEEYGSQRVNKGEYLGRMIGMVERDLEDLGLETGKGMDFFDDENLDPRAVVWQHGTSSQLLNSIDNNGFVYGLNQNYTGELQSKNNTIYFAREGHPKLLLYALNTCAEQYRKTGKAGKPVIITVDLSGEDVSSFVPDEDAISRKKVMGKYYVERKA